MLRKDRERGIRKQEKPMNQAPAEYPEIPNRTLTKKEFRAKIAVLFRFS